MSQMPSEHRFLLLPTTAATATPSRGGLCCSCPIPAVLVLILTLTAVVRVLCLLGAPPRPEFDHASIQRCDDTSTVRHLQQELLETNEQCRSQVAWLEHEALTLHTELDMGRSDSIAAAAAASIAAPIDSYQLIDRVACRPPYTGFAYRLGDMVRFRAERAKHNGRAHHYSHFPASIASDYLRATDEDFDMPALDRAIEFRQRTDFSDLRLPTNRTLVVHLRIGDIIDGFDVPVDELLRREHRDAYVRPMAFYLDILLQLARKCARRRAPADEAEAAESLECLTDVVFVGGYHKRHRGMARSEEYVARVQALFQSAGYRVHLRLDCHADEDVVYMMAAAHFVASGGSFSAALARLSQHRNHTVLQGRSQ